MRWLAVNDRGNRIGEGHPRAKLLDHDVDLVHRLLAEGLSYARIAQTMEVNKSCIAKIARGERRSQTAVDYRRAREPAGA